MRGRVLLLCLAAVGWAAPSSVYRGPLGRLPLSSRRSIAHILRQKETAASVTSTVKASTSTTTLTTTTTAPPTTTTPTEHRLLGFSCRIFVHHCVFSTSIERGCCYALCVCAKLQPGHRACETIKRHSCIRI